MKRTDNFPTLSQFSPIHLNNFGRIREDTQKNKFNFFCIRTTKRVGGKKPLNHNARTRTLFYQRKQWTKKHEPLRCVLGGGDTRTLGVRPQFFLSSLNVQ